MERKLTKIVNSYISNMKDEIKKKMVSLNISQNADINALFQFIYDYPKMEITKKDITKRSRAKNVVPLCDRCCALRANLEQCTRRRKNDETLCGTHLKGTPHGIIQSNNEIIPTKKITVFQEDIKGIIYFIDNNHNVYDPQEIHHNVKRPRIIAKWKKNKDGDYVIPEFS